MKKIPLTQGKFALVDDWNYERLIKYKWRAVKYGNTYYAITDTRKENGQRTTLKMHRLILNAKPGEIVDHCNREGLNNLESNLRITDYAGNSRNRQSHNGSASNYLGVNYFKKFKKYGASIYRKGITYYLGSYDYEERAAHAYDAAARYFSDIDCTVFAQNFPGQELFSKEYIENIIRAIKKRKENKSSKYIGVYFTRGRKYYEVQIMIKGKIKRIIYLPVNEEGERLGAIARDICHFKMKDQIRKGRFKLNFKDKEHCYNLIVFNYKHLNIDDFISEIKKVIKLQIKSKKGGLKVGKQKV